MMAEYELGKWDLSELAKNPKSPAFQKQIKDLENQARKFEKIKTKLNSKRISDFLILFQRIYKFPYCFTPMRNYIFILYRHFGKRQIVPNWAEYWIVSKSISSNSFF